MEFVQDHITTLHNFRDPSPSFPRDRTAVVVPIMGDDLNRPGLRSVLSTLETVNPGRIILSVRGNPSAIEALMETLAKSQSHAEVLWCNAPNMEATLANAGVTAPAGKGRDVWLGMVVAAGTHEYIVVHDADSLTYTRHDVPRLTWPLTQGYGFVKGYYARIEREQFFGRLVRLVWFPLLSVLSEESQHPLLTYLSSFRYPLAGEFAIRAEFVPQLQVYPRWGLETGMLGEMFDRVGVSGTAQVDLGIHQHDHRPVNGTEGLVEMTRSVIGVLFDVIDRHDIDINFDAIGPQYERCASKFITRYELDASFNNLHYDVNDERSQVASYRDVITDRGSASDRLPPFEGCSLTDLELRMAGNPAIERTQS